MSYEFLAPAAADVVARSPMERQARKAGARFEVRDGWNVAVAYAGEAARLRAVGFADASHMRKYEVQGTLPDGLEFGRATVDGDATWLPMTTTRALVLGGDAPRRRARRHHRLRRAAPRRPARARDVRALHRDRPAPAGHEARRLAPGLGRADGGRDPLRGRGPLPDAVRRGARPVRVDRGRRRRAATSAAARSARTRSCGRPPVLDIFRKRRMWRPRAGAQAALRRGHRRRRLARARHRLLPQAARDHRRRDPREELHRLGRGRAQHDDPALELQDARGRALLRRLGQALRGPLEGAELQPAVQPVRPPDARAHRPRDVRDGQPRRGQPPRAASTRA